MNNLKKLGLLNPLVLFVFFMGVFLSILICVFLFNNINKTNKEEFMYIQKRQVASIQRELDFNLQVLQSVESFFNASIFVDRSEFKKFVSGFLKTHDDIKALEWIPHVPHRLRNRYEKSAKRDLNTDFSIKENIDGKIQKSRIKDEYYPVYYVEPLLGNEKVLGFDLASNSIRLNSIREAIKRKGITATSRIKLIQENKSEFAFLVLLPIWEITKKLKGFTLGVYKISDVVNAALKLNKVDNSKLDIWIVDITNEDKEEYLFTNTNQTKIIKTDSFFDIYVAGRTWRLFAKPNSKLQKSYNSFFPFIILLSGIFITGLITYIMALKIMKANDLEILVKEKTKELEDFNKTLSLKIEKAVLENNKKDKLLLEQSKLAAMGEMIAAIAHQWRQPLNTLAIQLQFIEDDFEDGLVDTEYLKNYSKESMELVTFMTNTIDDFRDFFVTDKIKIKTSVKNKIIDTIKILKAQLENHNIKMQIVGNDFSIFANAGEFQQVILNIINNSKDALLSNKIKNPEIKVELEVIEKEGFIKIHDNAGGIKDDVIDRIFEPYFTTKEQGKGIGLGLYMSKMIIEENMSGYISAKNNEGGVTFIIKLGVYHD